jgi:hypothetical protein
VKAAPFGFVLLAGLASAASAWPADHLSPGDIHRMSAQFDGRRVTTGGDLRSVSDRCLSIENRRGGLFVVSKTDADRIRKFYRETGRSDLFVEGIYRAKLVQPGWATPSPCGEAGLEDVSVRAMPPQPGSARRPPQLQIRLGGPLPQ